MLCHAKLQQGDIGRTSGGECMLSAPPVTLFVEINVLVHVKQIQFAKVNENNPTKKKQIENTREVCR